jgi:CheY-like chemotaxis protein
MRENIDRAVFLVLEDHANMCLIWRSILHGMGAKAILTFTDPALAMARIREAGADVVVIGHNPPALDGVDLLSRLRASTAEEPAMVPVIASTGDARRSVVRALLDAGADEILAKPVSGKQASEKIASVVLRRRDFIRAGGFAGPDRRRRADPPLGPLGGERRAARA